MMKYDNVNYKQMKSVGLGIILISLIVLIIFTPKMMENISCLKTLMNNTTNIILLCVLTLCITLIDPSMGLAFALCVGIVAVYLKDMNTDKLKDVEAFMVQYQNPRSISKQLDVATIEKNEMQYLENMTNYNTQNNTKNNISNIINKDNMNHTNQASVNTMLKKKEEDKTNYLVNNKECSNTNNFLTQSGKKDPAGYDVSGCRYDMKSSPQNNTIYGPPLAWCNTYDQSKLNKCGTLFYPLNG